MRIKLLYVFFLYHFKITSCPFCDHLPNTENSIPFFVEQEVDAYPNLEIDELLEL